MRIVLSWVVVVQGVRDILASVRNVSRYMWMGIYSELLRVRFQLIG